MAEAKTLKKIELQERDFDLLYGLFECRILSLKHVSTIFFDDHYEMARKRVDLLRKAGFLNTKPRTSSQQPSILYITRKGFEALFSPGDSNRHIEQMSDWSPQNWQRLKKRSQVKPSTIDHELAVADIRASFTKALKSLPSFQIAEFCTWPLLNTFQATRPITSDGITRMKKTALAPDGFIFLVEEGQDAEGSFSDEYYFFLEVDRSTEVRSKFLSKAFGYRDIFTTGKLAERFGHPTSEAQQFPFRVLMVFPSEERRNNIAEQLVQENIALGMAWLTTKTEFESNPLGSIWMRPLDYRVVTTGTPFDPEKRSQKQYRTQPERELLVRDRVAKHALLG